MPPSIILYLYNQKVRMTLSIMQIMAHKYFGEEEKNTHFLRVKPI